MEPTKKKAGKETPKSACDMSVGEALISGLTGLRDTLKKGEPLEERFTMRTVELELEPQEYTPETIKAVRDRLGASQAVMAELLGVKAGTLQAWEQGNTVPRMARRLLDIISDEPEKWINILRDSVREKANT